MNRKLYLLFVGGVASLCLQPVNARMLANGKQVLGITRKTNVSTQNYSSDFYSKEPSSSDELIEHSIISEVKPSEMPLVSFGISKDDQLVGCEVTSDGTKLDAAPTQIYDDKGRLTYTKSPDGSYDHYVYSEDKQGRTVGEDKYEHKSTDEAGKETIVSSKTYGYDHLVGDDTDGKAYLIKEITYRIDQVSNVHFVYEIKEYNWFEAGKCFVLSGQRPGLKVTINIDGDVCEVTAWKGEVVNDEWGNWKKIKEEVWNVADNSTIYKDYDASTGEVTSARGNKHEVSSADGYVTTINYKYSADNGGSWIPTEKTVKTENYGDSWIYDGKMREKTTYEYDETKKDFVLKDKDVYEWVHQNINVVHNFHYDYKDGDGSKEDWGYEVFDENGEEAPGDIYLFKDWSYAYKDYDDIYNTNSSYNYRTFTFFDKDSHEQAKLRFEDLEYSSHPTAPLEVYENGKWEKYNIADDSYTLMLGDMGDYRTYQFNREGYLTKEERYYDGELDRTRLYTYTDNGYTERSYYEEDGGYNYPYDIRTCTVDADGTFVEIDTDYDEGNMEGATKTVVTKDGVERRYNWAFEENAFETEPSYTSVHPVTSVDDNGVQTTISRELQDGKVVETQKTEQKSDENGSTTIIYNKVENEWQPESKTEQSTTAKPQFALTMPSSPVKALNSSALVSDIDSTFFTNMSGLFSNISYSWNASTGSWDVSAGNESECKVEGNTLIYSIKSYDESGNCTENTRSYTRDNENRLVQYTEESDAPVVTRAALNTTLVKDFEYDEKGRLASVTITTDHVEKYVMNYGDEVTGINNAVFDSASSVIRISVLGKTITADGCKSLTLYTLDGKKVVSSLDGKVEAPTMGVFIVEADGQTTKLLVK